MYNRQSKIFVHFLLIISFLLLSFFIAPAEASDEIVFRADKLSDRVLFIKSGKSSVMSNVTAIASSKGMVVIDAHYKPEYGQRIRQIIEDAFGRKDFVYLIYTHAGVDHMGGAQAFPEALLIGHKNCTARIDGLREQLQAVDIREAMKPRLKLIKDQLDAQPDSPQARIKLEEAMLYWGELTELLASGFEHPKPPITFNESLALHLGDLNVRLRYCTPGYSESDSFIYVPEEKLLVVGDIFNKDRVPLISEKTDVRCWLEVFEPFIEGKVEVQYIVGAHDELMTVSELKVQLNYLKTLWEEVVTARNDGLTLEQAKDRFALIKRFPHLSHLSTRWVSWPNDLHIRNIEKIWEASELNGPYLGHDLPGMTPILFAPGLVSTEESDGCVGIGMGGDLFLFQRHINRKSYTYEMFRKDNKWSSPQLIPFSESHQVGDFALSPDGKTLFFASSVLIEGSVPDGTGGNIWVAERTSSGWTEPRALDSAVNTEYHDSYPCISKDGTLYFFSRRPGGFGKSDLYESKRVNGKYPDVINMGDVFNTAEHEWDPYIAPDQSYIVYCSMMPGGFGEDDLYVSFKRKDGLWSEPMNMGEPINSSASENRPWVSLDGKYFFFTSNRPGQGKRDVYWVSTKIIEKFRPQD